MSTERTLVPERVLERLRLGELTDEETRSVLERLDREEGGPARLEALIAADEQFLAEHPPERVARAILARHRARQAERVPAGRSGRVGLVLALAAAGAAAIGGLWLARSRSVEATQVTAEPVGGGAPEPATEPSVVRWDGRSARGIGFGTMVPSTETDVALEPGQIVTLKTTGIERVVVSDEAVLVASGSGERRYLEAKALGQAGVSFFARGKVVRSAKIRVLPPLDTRAVERASAEHAGSVGACFDAAGAPADASIKVRFAVDQAGAVSLAHAEWSTVPAEVERCVLDEIRGWSLPAGGQAGTGAVRLSAKERLVCVPGEDC